MASVISRSSVVMSSMLASVTFGDCSCALGQWNEQIGACGKYNKCSNSDLRQRLEIDGDTGKTFRLRVRRCKNDCDVFVVWNNFE